MCILSLNQILEYCKDKEIHELNIEDTGESVLITLDILKPNTGKWEKIY